MPLPVTEDYSAERGSVLLVVVAIVMLLGVMMSLGIGMFHTKEPIDRRLETRKKMEFVIAQLASYMHNYDEVPCPAAPNGAPDTVAFGLERGACTGVPPNTIGLVPFRTLGIDEEDAKDAWGRYFTYAVSPVFADPTNANDGSIFYRCRSATWINAGVNVNLTKARLCCPGIIGFAPGTDLVVNNAGGAPVVPGRTPGLGAHYANINALAPGLFAGTTATAVAVVLVSHGQDGMGAFTGAGTMNQIPFAAAPAAEAENADGISNNDSIFVDRTMILTEGSANYFDDIVMWRTQMSLYSQLNNASCARPWR